MISEVYTKVLTTINTIYNGIYEIIDLPHNCKSTTIVTLFCKKHNIKFTTRAKNIYNRNQVVNLCPQCKSDAKKLSPEVFFNKARENYGDKYIFDEKSVFTGLDDDITVYCRKHGYFVTKAIYLIKKKHSKNLCKKCISEEQTLSIDEFKNILKFYRGDDYIFDDKCVFINTRSPIKLYCQKHKKYFFTQYKCIISTKDVKYLCPECQKDFRNVHVTQEEYISVVSKNYPQFIYTETIYTGMKNYVTVFCSKHGYFKVNAHRLFHKKYKFPCRQCYIESTYFPFDEFKKKLYTFYGNRYTIDDDCGYAGIKSVIKVKCSIHGIFETVAEHLFTNGVPHDICPHCRKNLLTQETFLERARIKWDGIYIFDEKAIYENTYALVTAYCIKHKKYFQKPAGSFILNSKKYKNLCPDCISECKTFRLEIEINDFLIKNNINFIREYHNKFWLGLKSLDFYLPDYNVGIECQGEQHYKDGVYWGEYKKAEDTIAYDTIKYNLCLEHGIKIFYYGGEPVENYIDTMYTNIDEMLEKIIEYNDKNSR